METAHEYLKRISPDSHGFRVELKKRLLLKMVELAMTGYANHVLGNFINGNIRENGELFCHPPNITYCKQAIYPDFDCNTCKWRNKIITE